VIESRYWKEDLLAHARKLERAKKPRRWSERAVVNFEKELMISFFMVRALLERQKTSAKSRDFKIYLRKAPWNGKPVTQLNFWCIDELYQFDAETETTVSIGFLANQFVHARVIYAARDESRNWSEVLLCSDYETRKAIYRVPIPEIQRIFRMVGTDYTKWSKLEWDAALGDYKVTYG